MPAEIQEALGDISDVRRIYLEPPVTDEFDLNAGVPDAAAGAASRRCLVDMRV